MKIYALYKGEEVLAIGTILQISKKLNRKFETIRFYKTPTYKRRIKGKKNRRELVLIDES